MTWHGISCICLPECPGAVAQILMPVLCSLVRLGIMSPGAVPPVATETGDDPSAPPPPVNPYAQFISGVLKTTATDDPVTFLVCLLFIIFDDINF